MPHNSDQIIFKLVTTNIDNGNDNKVYTVSRWLGSFKYESN